VPKPKDRLPTFAEVVAGLPEADASSGYRSGTWVGPIGRGSVTYPAGVVWRLLQSDPDPRVIRRKVRDREGLVFEVQVVGDVRQIGPDDRDDYWAEVRPYLTGSIDREAGDHSDFRVGLFQDDAGQSMVVFERSC
jgi:hypothetical protein